MFFQQNINRVKDLNWSKFIADELHKALLKGRPTKGCLLFYNVSDAAFFLSFPVVWLCISDSNDSFYQLLYIDAINLTGLGISQPNGAFAINVWKKRRYLNCLMDVEADGISYGKLPVTLFFFSF